MQEKGVSTAIKNWSEIDRPREKLWYQGPSAVSDTELLALLIRSGSRSENAVSLAKRILASVNHSLISLGSLSIPQLMEFKGVGRVKAITIAAALEIGRRRKEEKPGKETPISNSEAAHALLYPVLAELGHEEFWVVYLNNGNRVIHFAQLSRGGITGTLVDIRLAMKKALELGAVSLILAHNHPSGVREPSSADKKITARLQSAAAALDLKILDHLIITRDGYYSFADQNTL